MKRLSDVVRYRNRPCPAAGAACFYICELYSLFCRCSDSDEFDVRVFKILFFVHVYGCYYVTHKELCKCQKLCIFIGYILTAEFFNEGICSVCLMMRVGQKSRSDRDWNERDPSVRSIRGGCGRYFPPFPSCRNARQVHRVPGDRGTALCTSLCLSCISLPCLRLQT